MDLRVFLVKMVVFCIGVSRVFCENSGDLWLIEQDFVKFGKEQAYEAYSQKLLRGFWNGKEGGCCSFAQKGVDSPQYVYLTPVGDVRGLEQLMDGKGAAYC